MSESGDSQELPEHMPEETVGQMMAEIPNPGDVTFRRDADGTLYRIERFGRHRVAYAPPEKVKDD